MVARLRWAGDHNNTIPRSQSSIISYFVFRLPLRTTECCSVVFAVTLHFVVVSRHQQTPPLLLPATSFTNLPRSGGTVLTTPGGRRVGSTRLSEILVEDRNFCLPHLHSTPPLRGLCRTICHDVWYKKREWRGYTMVKVLKICLFVLRKYTIVTDGRTDTTRRHRPRLCISSRGKTKHQCTRKKIANENHFNLQ